MTITISLLNSKLKVLCDIGKTTYASIKTKNTIFGKKHPKYDQFNIRIEFAIRNLKK